MKIYIVLADWSTSPSSPSEDCQVIGVFSTLEAADSLSVNVEKQGGKLYASSWVVECELDEVLDEFKEQYKLEWRNWQTQQT